MSKSSGYIRKFIIFKEEYSNMSIVNQRGHGKLESKGLKGYLTVNIEKGESDSFYNIAFVNKKGSHIVGKIYTEHAGKGKAEITFNLDDIKSKGFPVDTLNGIIIFRDGNVLLGGYILKDDYSINEYVKTLITPDVLPDEELEIVDSLEKAEETILEEIADELIIPATEHIPFEDADEIIPEEYLVPAREEVIPEEYMVLAKEDIIPEEYMVPAIESIPSEDINEIILEEEDYTEEEILKEEVLAGEVLEEKELEGLVEEVFEEEDLEDFEVELEEVLKTSSPNVSEYDNIVLARKISQRNQTTDYVLNILRYFPYKEPLKLELDGYNWWEISFDDTDDQRGFLPYFGFILDGDQDTNIQDSNIVFARALMEKYGHYIFGLYNENDEVKFYVYGVPGSFTRAEHPFGGKTGFNTYFEGSEIDGYWLLYIDPLHGRVIYPANPMTPND